MEEVTVQVFEVHELSEAAQEKAYGEWMMSSVSDPCVWDDNVKSLEAFAEVFGLSLESVSSDYVRFAIENEYAAELSGVRLVTWLYNNAWDHIVKGHYYSLWSKTTPNPYYTEGGSAPRAALKQRHSKVMFQTRGACPFTGYYTDDVLLDAIWDFLAAPSPHTTYEDLMHLCLNKWVAAYNDELNHLSSLDYFIECAEANDYRFTEDGRRFTA